MRYYEPIFTDKAQQAAHSLLRLLVVGCGNSVPEPTTRWLLSKVLAKFRKFSCHKFYESASPLSYCNYASQEERPYRDDQS